MLLPQSAFVKRNRRFNVEFANIFMYVNAHVCDEKDWKTCIYYTLNVEITKFTIILLFIS